MIILSPLWNAYTDAYVKNDFTWIQKTVRKTMLIWSIFTLASAFMIVVSPWIYSLWVGEKIASTIPFSISIACAVYVSIFNWNSLTSYFLNGIGKIKLQLFGAYLSMFIYVPLALFLGHRMGIIGVIYGLCIALLPGSVLQFIQYLKIINKNAHGIWNK
jgi:O-antigen/teichoic acid export membrane protein